MFWFSPKLPICEEDRQWVNQGFQRLERLFGRRKMLEVRVIEPTAEDFPDFYDRTPESVGMLFSRVCSYMKIDQKTVTLEIFADETEQLRDILPAWRSDDGTRTAGLYVHAYEKNLASTETDARNVVAIRSSMLRDPMSLVATIAHELGHVILLGGKLLTHETPDHEPITDLLTVFLGLGIFTANSAARFTQFQDDRRAGWSTQRLGYLPQPVFGYALAKFTIDRGERNPDWVTHLTANVRSDFQRAMRWLMANPDYVHRAESIG
jgi:hypothetical protein